MTRYVYKGNKRLKKSLMMCEDEIYLWLKKVTEKDIKEKALKVHLLNNHQMRQTEVQSGFVSVL